MSYYCTSKWNKSEYIYCTRRVTSEKQFCCLLPVAPSRPSWFVSWARWPPQELAGCGQPRQGLKQLQPNLFACLLQKPNRYCTVEWERERDIYIYIHNGTRMRMRLRIESENVKKRQHWYTWREGRKIHAKPLCWEREHPIWSFWICFAQDKQTMANIAALPRTIVWVNLLYLHVPLALSLGQMLWIAVLRHHIYKMPKWNPPATTASRLDPANCR